MKYLTIAALTLTLAACGERVVLVTQPTVAPTTVAPTTTQPTRPDELNDGIITVGEFYDWRATIIDTTPDASIQYALSDTDLSLLNEVAGNTCDALSEGTSYDEVLSVAVENFESSADAIAVIGLSVYTCFDVLEAALSRSGAL